MNKAIANKRRLSDVDVVVVLAGFTFLIYEVSWNRLLSLVLGTTVTASTIVLAAFMAGFGAGAYAWGRIAGGIRNAEKMLALLLGGVGLLGAVDYLIFARATPGIYSFLAGLGGSPESARLLMLTTMTVFLLLPAFLMGGVFPLVCRIALQRGGAIASSIGRLYALETLGSALGALATGFILLGTLGQRNTILLAVLVNLALAGRLFFLAGPSRTNEPARAGGRPGTRSESGSGGGGAPAPHRRTALLGAFVCGFSMLGLQVVWLRIFRTYLTNTSYTFALVSSLVILGLFSGSAIFSRRAINIGDLPRSMLGAILLLLLSAGMGLVLLINLPQLLMFPFQAAFAAPAARVFLLPVIASLLVIFPPALFSGYAFPLACRMYSSGRSRISRDVGLVLMVNTLGSVIGPLAAAFLLLPLLGSALSAVTILALPAIAAIIIVRRIESPRPGPLLRYSIYAAAATVAATVLFRPEIRILPPSFARFDRELLFYRESVEGTLIVGQDRGTKTDSKYTYVNNSAVIGSTYDAVKVVKMVGHFPFLLGLDCRDVLVIGFGVGVTTSAIASHEEVESIECVELMEDLKEAAVYYGDLNRNVVDDPRLTIVSGDGRHFLQQASKKYDLISCDPTHPILGSGNLYTRDYFALCRERLNPGGMVSQYLPLHKLRREELLGIIATFHSEFPNCSVWLGNFHAVLLGSLDPLEIDFDRWMEAASRIGPDRHSHMEGRHLAATLALGSESIAALTAGSRINTDDLSYTEFFAPGCLDEGNIAANLEFFMKNRSDISTVFRNIDDPETMSRFVQGNRLLTASLFHKFSGDDGSSLAALREACRVNPEDPEYPFLIRLYF